MKIQRFAVTLELFERLLGSSPPDRDIYLRYIAGFTPEGEAIGKRGAGSMDQANEELASLPGAEALPDDIEDASKVTVFPRDPEGRLHMWDYQLKGFLKEAGNILKADLKVPALRDKLDNYVYIYPRRILLCRPDGTAITEPDLLLRRTLRAFTMQGPRVSMPVSECILDPIRLDFELALLAHDKLDDGILGALLQYGEQKGLGQWRNASNGRFRVVTYRYLGTQERERLRAAGMPARKAAEEVAS